LRRARYLWFQRLERSRKAVLTKNKCGLVFKSLQYEFGLETLAEQA
jgi:hypothetical protein